MTAYLDLELKKGKWVYIRAKAKDRNQFIKIINSLKTLPVIKYIPAVKANRTSIYYFDYLKRIADGLGLDIYCSKKLLNAVKRTKYKTEHIKSRIKLKGFDSIYWTDDPKCQIRPDQAQVVNIVMAAKTFLIGDEMGLGKTVQILGIICKAFENGYKRALIVVPDKIKYQWELEVFKFTKLKKEDIQIIDAWNFICPKKKVKKVHLGRQPCRSCCEREDCKRIKQNPNLHREIQFSKGKIVICNYDIVVREYKVVKRSNFDIMILDEATGRKAIKNYDTNTAKVILDIRKSLPFGSIIVAMSGTFIENRLEDLYTPLKFIDERLVGEFYNFRNQYLVTDFWNNVIGYKNEKQLKEIINTWIIRRTIDEAWLDRPPITEMNKVCLMSNEQSDFYDDARNAKLKDLDDLKLQKKINTAHVGALINYLIQVCDSTETINPEIKYSTKLDYLKEIVEELRSDQKLVVFSFFANKVIPLIVRELKAMDLGKVEIITGKTKTRDLEGIKRRFAKDPDFRFLVLSDAASYGLNLQAAEYVVNFDLPWNPAIVAQRIRRVYRRGQEKHVTVINLVTTGTIEDRILEVLGHKKNLFDKFFGGASVKSIKIDLKTMIGMLKDA